MKRSLSCLLLLAMLLSLLTFSAPSEVFAAGDQPASYSDTYNSGTRDVVCTTLSGTGAADYYTGNYTYANLSGQIEDTLLQSLRKLMTDTHKKTSSYNDCRDMAVNTDCQNGDGTVVLLYTSYVSSRSEYNGWNREHVWPQSLGGGNTSGGGADLHHIRPSDAVVNSTRGNKKYGNANGGSAVNGSNPASGYLGGYSGNGYFEPLDNVKGDVARICLYVYVRWGSAWGADSITKVFQSVDVLLEWMELDPVDTWEMGRNEVVEAYQGNRNVFIDYPELAWLLFGEDIPANMSTPSGGSGSGSSTPSCTHPGTEIRNASSASCTSDGYTGDTHCSSCGKRLSSGTVISAPGHKDNNGDKKCDACGKSMTSGSFVKVTNGQLTSGKYVLVTDGGYAPDVLDGSWISYAQPTISGDTVTDPKGAVWTLTVSGNSVTLTDSNGVSIAPKGGNNNGIKSGSYSWTWSASNGGFIFKGTGSDTVRLARNIDYENQFRAYKESTATGSHAAKYPSVFTLYKLSEDGGNSGSGGSTPTCTHSKTEVRNASGATCTVNGYTGDTYCKDCGVKLSSGTAITAFGHKDANTDNKCDACGTDMNTATEDTSNPSTESTVPPTTEGTVPPTTEGTATTGPANTPTQGPGAATPDSDALENGAGVWIIAAIVVLLGAGVVVVILIKKKKS